MTLRRIAPALAAVALLAPPTGARAAPCWLDHGAVVAAASFGSLAGDVVIDLSRPTSALHETPARAAGLTDQSAVGDLRLAGRRLRGLSLPIADLDADIAAFDTNILAVIGWDVLGRARFGLDLRDGGCRLKLGGRRGRGRGVTLPLLAAGATPTVAAAVSDGTRTQAGWFAIDTAHEPSRFARARPERPPTPDAAVRLRALSLGGEIFEQIPAGADTAPLLGVDGRIGTWVWKGRDLEIDPVARTLRLKGP